MGSQVRGSRLSLLSKCFLAFLMFVKGTSSLAITGITLQTSTKKDDYVLHGEGAVLTCNYHLSPDEVVTSIEWLLEDQTVYLWRSNIPPSAKGPFAGRVDLNTKSAHVINITEAHMDMNGRVTCRITASQKTTEDSKMLYVIVDACPENSWSSHTDPSECTEQITMRCVGIFPRPSPQCGIYDEKEHKFIHSSHFDTIQELPNRTFEIAFTRRYSIKEFENDTDLSFSCTITIQETTWKRGVKLKLFGDPGCSAKAPKIDNGYYNLTDAKSCWGHHAEESEAIYTCETGFNLEETEKLICRNGSWVAERQVGTITVMKSHLQPRCSKGEQLINSLPTFTVLVLATLFLAKF